MIAVLHYFFKLPRSARLQGTYYIMNEKLIYRIGLTLIPGIGDVLAKSLVAYCGSAEAVFRQKKQHLLKIPGVGPASAQSIATQKVLSRAEEEIRFIEKEQITPLYFLDEHYPYRLKHCADSPVLLYSKGEVDYNHQKVISIVGTRNATSYGKAICKELIHDLKEYTPLIVSGLAYGIDICAHKAALDNGLNTVAVLAHGLDRIYPSLHKPVTEKMLRQGGLLSDYKSQTNPDRENFPKRNRIVAGISDATLVIEAGQRGGALITADIANSYSRDVFAVPGRTGDTYSVGCNNLIRTNRAALITSVKDIEYLMGWEKVVKKEKPRQKQLFIDLTADEKQLTTIIEEQEKIAIDTLALQAAMPVSKTVQILLSLELKGVVQSLPGKMYAVA